MKYSAARLAFVRSFTNAKRAAVVFGENPEYGGKTTSFM